jgi:hypothetical protein
MNGIGGSLRTLGLCVLFSIPALLPASSGAGQAAVHSQAGLSQVALSLEKTLPVLVSSGDYRSASNTAFLLATARSRLDETPAACVALAQSLEYYRRAIEKETGDRQRGSAGIEEASDGMAVVRARFGCYRSRSI